MDSTLVDTSVTHIYYDQGLGMGMNQGVLFIWLL